MFIKNEKQQQQNNNITLRICRDKPNNIKKYGTKTNCKNYMNLIIEK